MVKKTESKVSRRSFLQTAGAAGVAALASRTTATAAASGGSILEDLVHGSDQGLGFAGGIRPQASFPQSAGRKWGSELILAELCPGHVTAIGYTEESQNGPQQEVSTRPLRAELAIGPWTEFQREDALGMTYFVQDETHADYLRLTWRIAKTADGGVANVGRFDINNIQPLHPGSKSEHRIPRASQIGLQASYSGSGVDPRIPAEYERLILPLIGVDAGDHSILTVEPMEEAKIDALHTASMRQGHRMYELNAYKLHEQNGQHGMGGAEFILRAAIDLDYQLDGQGLPTAAQLFKLHEVPGFAKIHMGGIDRATGLETKHFGVQTGLAQTSIIPMSDMEAIAAGVHTTQRPRIGRDYAA